MKIIYFANFKNENSDRTEQHIKKAFEDLGHEVICYDETSVKEPNDMLTVAQDADMFLFHKAGVEGVISLNQLTSILTHITCPKVCWYFDKIEGNTERMQYINLVSKYADKVFVTDRTFIRRHKDHKLEYLPQGYGNIDYVSKIKEYTNGIVFIGNPYGEREEFVTNLFRRYGKLFKVTNSHFNEDLIDMCKSSKIIVAPEFPSDDFYWSSRLYLILGSGGFLIHPDLFGIKEDGELTEGKHFAGYRGYKELFDVIEYYMEHDEERERIKAQGIAKVRSTLTYKDRIRQLINRR